MMGSHRRAVVSAVLCVVLLASGSCAGGDVDPGARCGVERWAVKTLSDRDAPRVNLTPVPASVSALRALSPPAQLPATRIGPVEFTVYSLEAQVVEFKLEDDQDIHLVIADPNDRT